MLHQFLRFFGKSGNGALRLPILFLLLCCGFPAIAQQDSGNVDRSPSPPDSVQMLYEQIRARADSLDTLVANLLHSPGLPQFRKLRAAGGISRGVVAGGLVSLELSSPILTQDPQVILNGLPGRPEVEAIQGLRIPINDLTDTIITVRVPDSLPRGEYQIQILMAGQDSSRLDILQRPRVLYVASLFNIIGLSLLPLAALTILLVLFTRRSTPITGIKGLQLLFIEPQNMTYSLSRAQFVFWITAIAWGYMFLFFARGLVEDIWAFPPLSGFIYTFLISLGTLVAAQATSSMKGVKGAGQPRPSVSDLVVHGGVFALERVQQVLWTLISIGIFLVTIVKNYANATAMPEIPEELLVLMGLSSIGYLAGKATRKAGPVIHQVRIAAGSLLMNIAGEHLSRNAVLWVDGVERPEKPTVVAADQQDPNEFARELQVRLEGTELSAWLSTPHRLLLVHPDGQRCEWVTTPQILKITVGNSDKPNAVLLEIETEYVPLEPTFEVTGATVITPPTRNPITPNIWTAEVTPVNPKEKPFDEVRIPYGTHQAAVYAWKP